MDIKKNDIYTIKIEDMADDGSGIGRACGFALFVKDTVIGDLARVQVIKVKKNYGYGRVVNIIEPSSDRVVARCPCARRCGGCQLQHLSYERQLEFKQNKVENLLKRIGKVTDYVMHPVIGMDDPWYYRNKAQYPVGRGKDGSIAAGFYAVRTHDIVDSPQCCIQAPVNEQIVEIIKNWMEKYGIEPYDEKTHAGLVRHILTRTGFKTGEIMVCLVINGKELPHCRELARELQKVKGMTGICYNINTDATNVILGKQVVNIWGREYITDYIGGILYQISPRSFYQVNPVQTEKLYQAALDFADPGPDDTVWDLYCGIGTISLFMAKRAGQVYGVEIVPEAVRDAEKNAEVNGIDNVSFFTGKSEEILPEAYKRGRIRADIIVVDPPRKGCKESLLECICKVGPRRIVYISCDPATLARDLGYLEDHGYKVSDVQCCDMFPQTVHVETVAVLSGGETG